LTLFVFTKKNHDFGTLLHCFNDRSLDKHIAKAQNVLLWHVRRREEAHTVLCSRPCQIYNTSSRLWTRESWLVHARAAGRGSK